MTRPLTVDPVLHEQAPEKPTARSYTVVGPRKVLGHEPGETFTATLDPSQEQRLIAAGHLAVKAGNPPKQKEK